LLIKKVSPFIIISPTSVKEQAIAVVAGLPVPVYCIPTTTPVVLATVMMVDLAA
jgi:hypothetical protein